MVHRDGCFEVGNFMATGLGLRFTMVNMPLLKVRKLNQYQRLEWTFKNELIKLNQSFFSVLVLQSTSVQSPRVCLRFQTQGFSPPTGQGEQPQLLRSRCPCRIYDAPLALSLESHTHTHICVVHDTLNTLSWFFFWTILSFPQEKKSRSWACVFARLPLCPCNSYQPWWRARSSPCEGLGVASTWTWQCQNLIR